MIYYIGNLTHPIIYVFKITVVISNFRELGQSGGSLTSL